MKLCKNAIKSVLKIGYNDRKLGLITVRFGFIQNKSLVLKTKLRVKF